MVGVGEEWGLLCLEPSTAVWGAGREGAAAGAAAAGHRAGSSSLHTLLISVGVILSVVGIHALCASRIPLALSVMPHEGNRPRSGGMPLQVSALRSRTRIARVLSLELGWASAVVLSRDQMLKGCRGFADLTPIPSPVWATSGKQDSMFPSDRQAAQRLSCRQPTYKRVFAKTHGRASIPGIHSLHPQIQG